VDKVADVRQRALTDLRDAEVLTLDGHFDYGNGYHGRVYLNPHQLFRHPSTIWRVAQDLLDVLPGDLLEATEVVAGPVTGGALLAHTVAGLLDSRRSLTHPPCLFAPFNYDPDTGFALRAFYQREIAGRRVLLVDDVRNTGDTFSRCAGLVRAAGGKVLATAEIFDRKEAVADTGVPNIALVEYHAAENYQAAACPLCERGVGITRF
jgi:orotate phosphoribosyltransferase